ncbi:hypothetical protein [Methanobrevibacter sp.]|uniref:hypothetical protein n=1 Tax=Methanobrevibacter sp. TaxID=66852 RepID=UPI00388E9FAF
MMSKKSILIIIIVIIIIGFATYNQFYNQNSDSIKVGETEFTIPQGYSEGILNTTGDVNLTNGSNSLIIKEYDDTDIQKHINDYINANKNRNYTTKISNLTVDKINIYKSNIVNNTNTLHYWFIKHDKVYTVVTWDGNKNTDGKVIELISSAK